MKHLIWMNLKLDIRVTADFLNASPEAAKSFFRFSTEIANNNLFWSNNADPTSETIQERV